MGSGVLLKATAGWMKGLKMSAVLDWWLPDRGQGGSRKGNLVCGGGVSD